MKQTIDNEGYHLFLSAFQMFSEPAQLAKSELCNSCLVTNLVRIRPDLLPHKALKQVFSDTLNMLEEDHADSADLLRGRFWEGLKIEAMVAMERPRTMGKRSFSNHQRNAIRAFAFLFQQQEANCVESPIAAESVIIKPYNEPIIVANKSGKREMARPNRSPAYLLWIVPLILIGLVSVMFIRWINRPATWQTDGLGVIETVDDRARGEVIRLQGSGDARHPDQFEWIKTENQFNVTWMQKGSDYSATYIEVDTSNGFREFKFVPENDAPTFIDEQYQIGVGIDGRDGMWHLYDYDLQAIAADLEPNVTLNSVTAFSIKTSGETRVDDVQFTPSKPFEPAITLQDGVVQAGEMTVGTWHDYKITVPISASKLTVQLSELTADVDLYLRRNARPRDLYDCMSNINGLQNEVCVINQARESTWYVSVHGSGFEGVGEYVVTADYVLPDLDEDSVAWVTHSEGTIMLEENDVHLQGIGNAHTFNKFQFLLASGETQFNVSWELKGSDYAAVYVEVDTLNGERVFKFSPDDKAAVFEDGKRYKIGTPSVNRTGEWHTYTYDLQGIAAELEQSIVLREITRFYVGINVNDEVWVKNVSFD